MRSHIFATVIALGTLLTTTAFAAPSDAQPPTGTEHAERGEKHEGHRHFPMPAADFKAKVDRHRARARARMEEEAGKASADEAKALRSTFEANAQKVDAEVAKAVADGTVTKDEAKAVRAVSPHHGRHAHARGGAHSDRGPHRNGV